MAEVVTILSAISTSQQVLWQFSQLIGRYRGLPERILDLEENLHACNLTLQVWKARWGVEERHTSKAALSNTSERLLADNRVQTPTTRSSGGEKDGKPYSFA